MMKTGTFVLLIKHVGVSRRYFFGHFKKHNISAAYKAKNIHLSYSEGHASFPGRGNKQEHYLNGITSTQHHNRSEEEEQQGSDFKIHINKLVSIFCLFKHLNLLKQVLGNKSSQ